VNRKELQALAETRLKDAQALFQSRRFDGAYYLAGYAVECALKACIAKRTKRHDFPDKDFAQKVFLHDVARLLEIAGLAQRFEQGSRENPEFEDHWTTVRDWSERSRYEAHGRQKALAMLNAVTDPQGVLACIKEYW
jgi:HEPN domain-containing protein